MAFPTLSSWRGRTGRAYYFSIGFALLAIKHNLDRLLAAAFQYNWGVFNYWVFSTPQGIENITDRDAIFYGTLLLVALSFVWIGTIRTWPGSSIKKISHPAHRQTLRLCGSSTAETRRPWSN